ncbi:MAG: hypothetical protein AAB471_01875 [Patescibacteria group bacterium]|mgnify:CR=1 FL=1
MRIIDVIPFVKGSGKETLSYFSAKDIASGNIVTIPLRGRTVVGLVVGSQDALGHKSALRSSAYRLKKVTSVAGENILSKAFIETAYLSAEFYVTSAGEIIAQTVPRLVFEKYKEFQMESKSVTPPAGASLSANFKPEKFIFQREPEERRDYYKTLIRTELARGASLFLVLPTEEETEDWAKEFSKGIEKYVYLFHGGLSKKEIIKRYVKLMVETRPVLIVGTPHYLFINREDLKTIIVEHESSSVYRTLNRPYIDFRLFAEILAGRLGQKIILADTLLQIETLYRHECGLLLELTPPKWRIQARGQGTIVDTREKETPFKLISQEAQDAIVLALSKNANVFVYTARRGMSPITVCGDCGTTLVCARCNAPLVLHGQSGGRNIYICHKCRERRDADLPCPNCNGWRMTPLGYGSESVKKELSELFPKIEVQRFDKDTVTTRARARNMAAWFEKSLPASNAQAGKGKIMVGTEMALYYISSPIDTVIVASIDSLASIPSFRIQEKIFRILLALKIKSERSYLLQTRLADKKIFERIIEGDLINFYRAEIKDRKDFRYPPFTRLIKITVEGKKPAIDKEAEFLVKKLEEYKPEPFSAFISKVKSFYRTNIVLRLEPHIWAVPLSDPKGAIDKKLHSLLCELPPSVTIRVDPEDLL